MDAACAYPFILQDMTYNTDSHVTEGKRVTTLNVYILVIGRGATCDLHLYQGNRYEIL